MSINPEPRARTIACIAIAWRAQPTGRGIRTSDLRVIQVDAFTKNGIHARRQALPSR
jgi:hypothetical protein